MSRFSCVVLLVLASVGLSSAAKGIPGGGVRSISDAEIDMHPKFQPTAKHRGVTMIPTSFDARTKWPNCVSIKTIRDQGQCGTCWAVSATSVLSDRLCIASGQKDQSMISANQAAGCVIPGQTGDQNCEAGGDPSNVYKYASLTGLPTGGAYNSDNGCIPYQGAPNTAPPMTCARRCTNTDYPTDISKDLKLVDSYWINYQKKNVRLSQAEIDSAVNQMQVDLMTNGPITATMTVFQDFQDWSPSKGPYRGASYGSANKGGHAIRIIGWNKDAATGISYWLIANSWGVEHGDKGIYWIEMGKNVVGIENTISAPIVKMLNPCSGASFCDTPIDQAVVTDLKSSSAPIFLFQGNCTQQVAVSGGKLKAVGGPLPLSKTFLGAPAGPITSYMMQDGQLWLLNDKGQAAANCKQSGAAAKFSCGGGSGSGGASAQANFAVGGYPTSWSYYPDNAEWLFDTNGQGKNIGDKITSKFSSVTALLNLDGKQMLVSGKDQSGKSVSGIMSYPVGTRGEFSWVSQPGPTKNVLTCSA